LYVVLVEYLYLSSCDIGELSIFCGYNCQFLILHLVNVILHVGKNSPVQGFNADLTETWDLCFCFILC